MRVNWEDLEWIDGDAIATEVQFYRMDVISKDFGRMLKGESLAIVEDDRRQACTRKFND